MPVRGWHSGKIIILWSWGGVIVALAMTDFMTRPVVDSPVVHLLEFLASLLLLLALSIVTWHWLGGREGR